MTKEQNIRFGPDVEPVLKVSEGVSSELAGTLCHRYDNLVGMFSNKPVPAVGVSLGIERIFSILEQKFRAAAAESGGQISETKTQVCSPSALLGTHPIEATSASFKDMRDKPYKRTHTQQILIRVPLPQHA